MKAAIINEKENNERKVKDIYPEFDYSQEIRNPLFVNLLEAELDMLRAYQYVHRNELFTPVSLFIQTTIDMFCSSEDFYNLLVELDSKDNSKEENIKNKSISELEIEAEKSGISVGQLIDLRLEEERNHSNELKRFAESALLAQNKFPLFDLRKDWNNDLFRKLIKVVDFGTAHEVVHFNEYYTVSEKKNDIPDFLEKKSENKVVFCRKCGTRLIGDGVFCHKCGTRIIPIEQKASDIFPDKKEEKGNITKKSEGKQQVPIDSAAPKEYGTGWLKFLYGFFVFQCVIMCINIVKQCMEAYTVYPFVVSNSVVVMFLIVVIVIGIIQIVVKIMALIKIRSKSGYFLMLASLFIDGGVITLSGYLRTGYLGLMVCAAIAAAVIIPNIIYVKHRKYLYF